MGTLKQISPGAYKAIFLLNERFSTITVVSKMIKYSLRHIGVIGVCWGSLYADIKEILRSDFQTNRKMPLILILFWADLGPFSKNGHKSGKDIDMKFSLEIFHFWKIHHIQSNKKILLADFEKIPKTS